LSEDRLSLVTFASAGLLIASILIFSLVAMPELLPAVYPQLRHGTVAARIVSTSGQLVVSVVPDMEVTITSMQLHRVGVGEGNWVTVLGTPISLNPIQIAQRPFSLNQVEIPTGDYNLMKISFGNSTATIRGLNVTLTGPAQDLKVPAALAVTEGKRTNLIVDLSFNEAAVVTANEFDPDITVTVEQPGQAPISTILSLKPLASLGSDSLEPGGSNSSTFTVPPGGVVENYLVHAEGGLGVENTFDLEINETGEFWYGLTGNVWLLGGNLTSGMYHMNVRASPGATERMRFAVSLYRVPRITADLPDASFSGLASAKSSQSIRVNEFALYLDKPGMYDFYLSAKTSEYEFLVDNNPESVVSGDRMITLQLTSGLHTFQIFADVFGSGRDTSWSVGVVPAPSGPVHLLSREALLSTALLVVAALVFVVDVSVRQLRRRGLEKKAMRLVEREIEHETPHPSGVG
jgi:hypothetical protein